MLIFNRFLFVIVFVIVAAEQFRSFLARPKIKIVLPSNEVHPIAYGCLEKQKNHTNADKNLFFSLDFKRNI